MTSAHTFLEPTEGDEAAPNRLEDWKNVTAFISQLVNSGYTKLIYLAIWEIYDALESPPTEVKALMDCRVWTVTEWILRCSQLLMNEMKPPEGQIEESKNASEAPGPLFGKDLPSQSVQRWDFWKRRLVEILDKSEEFGVETKTRARVEGALKAMELMS